MGNSQQTYPFTTFSYETDRSKIENQYALNKFQDKFYGKVPISSQLNQKKGLKTIDIFERTRAKSYSMPQNRKWTKKEAVPVPLFVNLSQVGSSRNPPAQATRRGKSDAPPQSITEQDEDKEGDQLLRRSI